MKAIAFRLRAAPCTAANFPPSWSEGLHCGAAQNPEAPSPPAMRSAPKAQYPEEKKEEFKGYAWIPARDPTLLDQRGCQILLIGARPDIASAPEFL